MNEPRLARRQFLGVVVGGAGVVVVGAGAGCAPSRGAQRVPATSDHPLAGLADFDGNELVQLPSMRGGKATVVDFWASWCGPCRQGFRYLDQLYRTWLGRGLDMIAVSVDDDPTAARRFAASFRPRFPLAWDANADVRERFSVVNLPTTLLFDGDGQLVVRNVGFDLADHRALEERVRLLLDAT